LLITGQLVIPALCTGDGIVGQGSSVLGDEAFIWTPSAGTRDLKDVLVNDFGLDLTGWTLTSAKGISADGTTIAGWGTNTGGNTKAWVVMPLVITPCPSDVNGDRIDDLIIGADRAYPNANSSAGESYVVFGRNVVGPPCPGDANSDGFVNFSDITTILGNFGNDYMPGTGPGDSNNEGIVNFSDVTTTLGNWLAVCP